MKICPYLTASMMQRYPDEDSFFYNYSRISDFMLALDLSEDIDDFEKRLNVEFNFSMEQAAELVELYYAISCKEKKCARFKACNIESEEQ